MGKVQDSILRVYENMTAVLPAPAAAFGKIAFADFASARLL